MSSAPTELVVQARPVSLRAKDVHEKMLAVVYDELSKLPELLQQMEPKERLTYLFRLIPYAVPPIKEIEPTLYDPLYLQESMAQQKEALETAK